MDKQENAAYPYPTYFSFEGLGFPGPIVNIDWKQTALHVRAIGEIEDVNKVTFPTVEAWHHFWSELDKSGFWEWDKESRQEEYVDGVNGYLSIRRGFKSRRIELSNTYPSPKASFDHLIGALEKLAEIKIL